VSERAAEKQAQRHAEAELPADPWAEARREEKRAIREIAETVTASNLDLGRRTAHSPVGSDSRATRSSRRVSACDRSLSLLVS
jgi:hypothetical protein